MGYAIGIVAVGVLAALIRQNSPSLRAMTNRSRAEGSDRAMRAPSQPTGGSGGGRDRVPAGWYLAPASDPAPSRGGAAPGDAPIPARTIRVWTAGAAAFVVLDVLAWVTGYPVLGVVIAVLLGVALTVVALDRRRNRWIRQAGTWNTGHHHDFPPPATEHR